MNIFSWGLALLIFVNCKYYVFGLSTQSSLFFKPLTNSNFLSKKDQKKTFFECENCKKQYRDHTELSFHVKICKKNIKKMDSPISTSSESNVFVCDPICKMEILETSVKQNSFETLELEKPVFSLFNSRVRAREKNLKNAHFDINFSQEKKRPRHFFNFCLDCQEPILSYDELAEHKKKCKYRFYSFKKKRKLRQERIEKNSFEKSCFNADISGSS